MSASLRSWGLSFVVFVSPCTGACTENFSSASSSADAGGNGGTGASAGTNSTGSGGSAGAGGRGAGGAGAARPADGAAGAPQVSPEAGAGATPEGGEAGTTSPRIPTNGMILWLAADVGISEQTGLVSRWDDRSPLRGRAVQDLPEQQPTFVGGAINGRPGVRFDGNDDYLQLPQGFSDFSNGLSIFAVAEADAPNCTSIFEASNGSEIDDIALGQDNTQVNYEVLDATNTDVVFPVMVPVELGVVHHADGVVEVRRNGLFGAGGSMPLPAVVERKGVYVGRSLYGGCPSFGGAIGEVILYSRALDDTEVQLVENYLESKYGCCAPN